MAPRLGSNWRLVASVVSGPPPRAPGSFSGQLHGPGPLLLARRGRQREMEAKTQGAGQGEADLARANFRSGCPSATMCTEGD